MLEVGDVSNFIDYFECTVCFATILFFIKLRNSFEYNFSKRYN